MLLERSRPLRRLIESGQLTYEMLPARLDFTTHESVSAFLATPWLWEHLAPAKHVLMFQTDIILCYNGQRTMDDFLEYDFIRAPIERPYGTNYRGGLSLRNRERLLEVLRKSTRPANAEPEDQWFIQQLNKLPPKPNGEPGANLPSRQLASQFAVEFIRQEKPFGMHQISKWHPDTLKELMAWCPEHQLAIE